MPTLKSYLIHRHDSSINWENINPILAQAEFGVEDDTGKFKIGDGTLTWKDLPYNGDNFEKQLNQLEKKTLTGIKLNQTLMDVVDGIVNIPIASEQNLGIVKSSTEQNNISVNIDGIMTVNSVNVNKLTQTDGEKLILNGGNADI